MDERTKPGDDRSARVFPLATGIMQLLNEEADVDVRIVAFDVVKVAMEVQRFDANRKQASAMKRLVLDQLTQGAASNER